MRAISILNKEFKDIISSDVDWEWRSPTGISMQSPDVMNYDKNKWMNLKPIDLYTLAKTNPNKIVHLDLLSSCYRSFSRCKIKNLKIVVWDDNIRCKEVKQNENRI